MIIIPHKKIVKNNRHILNKLSGKECKVATLPKSYLTIVGNILQSLKSIGQC